MEATMPRAKDTKVWNEDLLVAMRSREELCRQRYSERQYLWRDGARAIQAVRQDIYQSSGRFPSIVGLPNKGLSKLVEVECRAIIMGKKPILPEGHVPTTRVEQKICKSQSAKSTFSAASSPPSNRFHQDPYLKRIKMRGGAYAILMAFHFSQAEAMTKAQICTAAQEFCDEEMEPNFGAGRAYGAWNGKKTLLNHGLLQESRSMQMGRRGHVCNGVFEYRVTGDGLLFTEALLEKFPQQSSPSSASNSNGNVKRRLPKAKESTIATSSLKFLSLLNNPKPMKVKQKCENKTKPLLSSKVEPTCLGNDALKTLLDSGSESDSDDSFTDLVKSESQSAKAPPAPKSAEAYDLSSSDSEDDFEGVISKYPSTVSNMSKSPTVIDLIDSDSDEDEEAKYFVKENMAPRSASNSKMLHVRDAPSNTQPESNLIILIDSRERNRNATPRQMRVELSRHITSGDLSRVWPDDVGCGVVEEEQLSYGDFVFGIRSTKDDQLRRLPCSIERKRVGDLVQRSHRADHWSQLNRMRDCCEHAILLIEGNTSKTAQFTSYNHWENEDSWNPDQHSICDEHSYYRFLGRAILSSPTLKIWQTKDEQATYRTVGAVGLVAARLPNNTCPPRSAPSSKVEINKLYNKLKTRGVPWQIARRLSEELGSTTQLDRIYKQCERSGRKSVLAPIINHSCSSLIKTEKSRTLLEYGTVEGWSSAIESAWYTKVSDPSLATRMFDEYKVFVDDRSKLLRALHSDKSGDSAVQEANIKNADLVETRDLTSTRKVRIESQPHLAKMFPSSDQTDTFYLVSSVDDNPLGLCLPSVVMETVCGEYKSDKLVVSILEGATLLERIQDAFHGKSSKEGMEVGRLVARQISSECCSFLLRLKPPKNHDRRVLIVRGLFSAMDEAAKRVGYRPELKLVADFVLAELMLRHNVVVIHAFRQKGHLEMIVREFAMACFFYQLVTRRARH